MPAQREVTYTAREPGKPMTPEELRDALSSAIAIVNVEISPSFRRRSQVKKITVIESGPGVRLGIDSAITVDGSGAPLRLRDRSARAAS